MSSMSQTARNRKAAPPPKGDKRRRGSDSSSSLDLSSDGGYSALDEVSDDDDEDENFVYAAEEKAIINDVTKSRHTRSPRPTVQKKEDEGADEDSDGDDEDDDDDEDDNDLEDIPVNDEEDYSSGPDVNVEDSLSWHGILESDINNGSESPVRRHVRFAGVPDSDNESDSNSTPSVSSDEFFPDVFIEKQSLDEAFRRQIEEESDSSNSATFWDFTAPAPNPVMDALPATDLVNLLASEDAVSTALGNIANETGPESESESGDDQDGYESDGDTTEDDEPQLLPPRRKSGFRNAQPVDDDSSDSDSENFVPVRNRRGHPRIGRFALSNKRSKPIAVINPVTRKMVIFTPEAPRETEVLTDPIPLNLEFFPVKGNNIIQSSPLQRHANHLLFSDAAQPASNSGIIHSDPVGSSLGLGSYNDFGLEMGVNDDSDEVSAEFGEDPGEHTLRIEDFICFDRNPTEPDAALGAVPGEAPNTAFDATGTDDVFDSFFDTTALDATLATLPDDVEAAINGLFSDNMLPPDDPFFNTGLSMGMGIDLSSSIMGDDNNNDNEDGATPAETPTATTPGGGSLNTSFAAVADPSPAAASAEPDSPPLHPLMAHFSKNADVGAFRRNQINQQLISSNKATAESLAFSGPLSMGTLRGIKHGSLSAVSAPLTPPRRPKRKAHENVLEGPTTHKRYRSISEVKDLAL